MGFVAQWLPALAAALILSVAGFLLRARVRHSQAQQRTASRSEKV